MHATHDLLQRTMSISPRPHDNDREYMTMTVTTTELQRVWQRLW